MDKNLFNTDLYPNRFKPVYGLIFKSSGRLYYFSAFNLLDASLDSKKWTFRSLEEDDGREYTRTLRQLVEAMDQKKIVSQWEFMKKKQDDK